MIGVLDEHLGYVSDPIRLEKFRTAIACSVLSGDRVADLGCGSAVLGLFCLQAGAGHVDAIDSTAAIQLAKDSLRRSGWDSHTNFIHSSSYRAELSERVDVVICDHVGYFGFDYGLIEMLADARHRFLKPGGKLIPGHLKLNIAAVESENCHALAEGWNAPGIPPEFHWLRKSGVNSKYAVKLQLEDVLGGPSELACIDLYAENPDFFSWNAELSVDRDGVLHGLAGWFDCELAEGVWMTNSPLSKQAIDRQQAFLPINEALRVKAGDLVSITVLARPADNLIAWELRHPATGKRFSHSTWQGDVMMQQQLVRAQPDYVPQLSPTARARAVVLGLCDGQRSVSAIQDAVNREHPHLFPSEKEIARFVASVLRNNTE